jgi:hypothetical protein
MGYQIPTIVLAVRSHISGLYYAIQVCLLQKEKVLVSPLIYYFVSSVLSLDKNQPPKAIRSITDQKIVFQTAPSTKA